MRIWAVYPHSAFVARVWGFLVFCCSCNCEGFCVVVVVVVFGFFCLVGFFLQLNDLHEQY